VSWLWFLFPALVIVIAPALMLRFRRQLARGPGRDPHADPMRVYRQWQAQGAVGAFGVAIYLFLAGLWKFGLLALGLVVLGASEWRRTRLRR
jgi:hypothetical protein